MGPIKITLILIDVLMYRAMCTLIFLTILIALWLAYSMKKPKNYPPGPIWLPLLGSMLHVRSEAKRTGLQRPELFERMRARWGADLLGLKLGEQLVVVAFGHRVLREVFRNDVFQARPNNFFGKLRVLGSRPGITCAEGRFHAEQKRFIMKSWWGGSKSAAVDAKISEELKDLMQLIDASKGPVAFGPLVQPAVINAIWSLLTGRRIDRNDEQFRRLLALFDMRTRAFDMEGGTLSNFPWLRHVAPDLVGYTLIKEANLNLKNFIMKAISDHHRMWSADNNDDLMFSFISRMRSKDERSETFHDDQLLMIALDLFLGGTHTTGSTLNFAFLMMLLHPEIQRKARESLDKQFDADYSVQYSDRFKVPYVLAVLQEVIRFCHVLPIGGARRALANTELDGYNIPKGTIVLMHLHSVLMSKEIWHDPEVFRPERFIDGGKIKMYQDYFPFGMGRRRCLGETFALRFLFVFFAELSRRYKILPENGKPLPSAIPLPGIVSSPQPYAVKFTLRNKYKST